MHGVEEIYNDSMCVFCAPHTFTRTYETVRQGECGGVKRGCRDKELRHWGGWGGVGFAASVGEGVGA